MVSFWKEGGRLLWGRLMVWSLKIEGNNRDKAFVGRKYTRSVVVVCISRRHLVVCFVEPN